MRHAAKALIAVSIAASAVGCAGHPGHPGQPGQPSHAGQAARSSPGHATRPASTCSASEPHPHRYFGIIDGNPGGPAYTGFTNRTGAKPTLVDYFFNFGTAWNSSMACFAARHSAMPLMQFNLRHLTAADIAGGGSDRYISHLADQVKAFGLPIVISIGHEMNGNWYPWGWQHTPAPTFIRMWRRVHDIFGRQQAINVIWMWTVNRAVKPAINPRPWWPGQAYVNWVGVDGHDRHATDTFKKVFGSTIADVRALTNDPILISETAVVAGPHRPAQIAELFRTVYQTPGLIGILYLNMWTVRIDWRLSDTASIRAFTKAIQAYEPSSGASRYGPCMKVCT